MAVTTTSAPVLILYDSDDSTQESSRVAIQLRNYLSEQRIACGFVDYAYTLNSSAKLPQYLILIYSSRPQKPSSLSTTIDKAIDLTVERRMRNVIAITTASASLPSKWASIPAYRANDYSGENQLAEAVLQGAQHVKLPYSQSAATYASRQPSMQRRKGMVPLIVLFVSLLVIVVVIGGSITGLFPNMHLTRPSSASENPTTITHTTVPPTGANGTRPTTVPQSSPPSATEQQAEQKDFNSVTNSKPVVDGFKVDSKWDSGTYDDRSCAFLDPTYFATVQTANKYNICLANALLYKNFALQMKMAIDGDAGGVIFRSGSAGYYRLSVNVASNTPGISLFHCINGQCDKNESNSGKTLGNAPIQVDGQSLTLTVIARNKNIAIYTNGKLVKNLVAEDPVEAGKIGVHAAALSSPTTKVTFSDLKIWSLDQ